VVIGGYHHFTAVEGIADEAVFLADPQLGRVSITVEQFKGVWSGAVLKISEARPIEAAPAAKECDSTSDAAKHPVVPAGTKSVGPALTDEIVANLPAEEMSGAQEVAAAAGAEPVGTPTAAASADHAPESPPASQAATESMAGAAPTGADEQQVTETPAVENATADTNARQQEIVGVPENFDKVEIPETNISVPDAQQNTEYIKIQSAPIFDTLSGIKVEQGQPNALTDEEMKETWGKGLPIIAVKVGIPLAIKFGPKAKAAIVTAAKHGQRILSVELHPAHHPFRWLGGKRLPHIQVNMWRHGVKGSHKHQHIPLPSRFFSSRWR
jgi:predicted double-glycine peptidase